MHEPFDAYGCACGYESLIHMDALVVICMDALAVTSPFIHMNAVVVIHLDALVVPSHLTHMHARVVTSHSSMHESSHTSEYVCGDESCLCA